jgi:hypothetical protein
MLHEKKEVYGTALDILLDSFDGYQPIIIRLSKQGNTNRKK